jgi:hypothetical protein
MPWNLLIFPLAAAYYIISRSYYFKFRQQRLDRQRLLFETVLLGLGLATIMFTLRSLLQLYHPEIITKASNNFPFKENYTITAISTIPFSWIIVKVSNRFLNKKTFIRQAIKKLGSELELLFKISFDEKKLLQITLDSGKVYVGWIKELPIPSVSNCVRIIPALSGYRSNETKDVIYTSHYLNVYAEYIKEGKINGLDQIDSDLVLNTKNIVGVSYFDLDMHKKFSKDSVTL